jgi:hypothetical protein
MADPTGTSGLSAAQQSDLALATQGGPKFMARLQQLADATDAHEQAFAKARVGNDIAAALEHAQGTLAIAKTAEMQARQKLADAHDKAMRIIAESEARADENDITTQKQLGVYTQTATKIKADADEYAMRVRAEADQLLANANDLLRRAKDVQNKADAAAAAAKAAHKDANDRLGIAEQTRADFHLRTERLKAAIQAVTT